MKKVAIREIVIKNADELSRTIKDALIQCEDTQIFISNTLFERFLKQNRSRIIWEESVVGSFHYCDKLEKAYIFTINDNNETKTVQMHFVKNCLHYTQLTFYASKGIVYRNYLKGMKIVLIISSD